MRFDRNVIQMLEVSTDFAALCHLGKIREINCAGRALLGGRDGEMGLHLADLVDQDYRDIVEQMLFINVVETHPTPVKLRRLDGAPVEVSLLIHPARELGPGCTVVTARDISREGRLARSARDRADRFRLLVENSMHLICQCIDQKVAYLNPAGMRMLRLDTLPDDMSVWDVFSDEYRELFLADPNSLLDEGMTVPARLRRAGGELFDANVLATRLANSQDASDFMIEARDITAHNRAVAALRRTNETLEQRVQERTLAQAQEKAFAEGILQAVPHPVWWKDTESRYRGYNQAFRDMHGLCGDEWVGSRIEEVQPAETAGTAAQFDRQVFLGRSVEYETRIFRRADEVRTVQINKAPWRDAQTGQPVGIIGVMSDITERKRLEADLLKLATTDPLTGSFNRRHFMERAATEAQRCLRHHHDLSVLMLDIDRFKSINDNYGHPVGDRVIRALAEACAAVARHEDIVGRLGGEEFAIILPETSTKGAALLAERLRRAVAGLRVCHDGGELSFTISVGVCGWEAPAEEIEIEPLLSRADAALYRAKQGGRNRVCCWLPTAEQ